MSFEVLILGSNSAMSSHGRHPSSQLLKIHGHTFLIDCGEGTQFQLQKYKCKPFRINCIFISHLHGDHYFGLIGILTTFQLLRRQTQLTIFGPPELEEIIELQLSAADSKLTYPLEFVKTQAESPELIFEDEDVSVTTIPLQHRIPCTGFVFREKVPARKINSSAVKNLSLRPEDYDHLKMGLDITDNLGGVIKNEDLTLPNFPPRSYAYCTDTLFLPHIAVQVKDVNLLYHETTFMQEYHEKAQLTFHSTSIQAATIAKEAQVKEMIVGHFSSKYSDLNPLLEECVSIFPNTKLAIEGEVYQIKKIK